MTASGPARLQLLVATVVMATCVSACGGGDESPVFAGTPYENVPAFNTFGGYTESLGTHLRECGVDGDMDAFVSSLSDQGQGVREISEPNPSGDFLHPARRVAVVAIAPPESDIVYRVTCVNLRPDVVATVGGEEITLAQFDEILAETARLYKAEGEAFPPPPEVSRSIRVQIVGTLVDAERAEQLAPRLGIQVSDSEVERRLAQIKRENFGGSEKRYRAELVKQGVTDAYVRERLRAQLLTDKIPESAQAEVHVTYAPGFAPRRKG